MYTSEMSKVTGVSTCWVCNVFRVRRVDVIEKGGASGYRSRPIQWMKRGSGSVSSRSWPSERTRRS
jgi:hypothetical protein